MKFTYNAKVGKNTVTFTDDATDIKDAWEKLSHINIFPTHCGHCQKDDLFVMCRTAKNFKFYEVKCRDCEYSLKYGQHTEGNTLYQKDWAPPFVAKEATTHHKEASPF